MKRKNVSARILTGVISFFHGGSNRDIVHDGFCRRRKCSGSRADHWNRGEE